MLTRELIDEVFAAFSAMDLDAVMQHFAEDAVLIDPHYPQPHMVGHQAIRRGLSWGLGKMVKPGLSLRHVWIDADSAAIEVDTHHRFKGGIVRRFDQLFVVETRAGKITRLQVYVPYAAPGMAGLLTRLTRLVWRWRGIY